MKAPMNPSVLLAGIGVAITTLLGYNLVHKPQQRQLSVVRAAITAEQTRQQTVSAIADALQQVEQYRGRLPGEPDPSWLVRHVVSVAEHTGVQLTSIGQEPPQRFEQFTRLAVRLQIAASYHRLGTFLDLLERSPFFLRVDSLDIAQPPSSQDHAQPEDVTMTLSTMYLPPGATIVGGGAAP